MTGSPELPSDLDDSDNLDTGSAREKLDSSPYAGGAPGVVVPLFLSGSSNVTLDPVEELLSPCFNDLCPWP